MSNFRSSIKNKNEFWTSLKNIIEIGKCISIKDSNKNFQIIGINKKRDICWVREWPLNFKEYKTFTLSIEKILISSFCEINLKKNN